MASLRISSLLQTHSSSSSSKSNRRMSGAASMQLSMTESMTTSLMKELIVRNSNYSAVPQGQRRREMESEMNQQMHLILEEVADRIEMHTNIGKQRENWNSLLLNSINMMTLTGVLSSSSAAAAGTTATTAGTVILFGAATGMLLIMNKIQPSQLAEEQRNAVRLFKELKTEIESILLVSSICTKSQVDEMMKKVLALDRAYPLPLLGKMLEKFPKKLQSAVWWPNNTQQDQDQKEFRNECWCNGWSEELEVEMRAVAHILKTKDEADYLRLGNIALKTNKVLAISGPLLTGFAAAASITHAPALAAMAGAMAVAVNTFQHAGQVGMVVEMYRNCAGFFRMMEESIDSTLKESDLDKRENGELFERKVALKLGRSLSQLRHLAATSKSLSSSTHHQVDEFGSKLF